MIAYQLNSNRNNRRYSVRVAQGLSNAQSPKGVVPTSQSSSTWDRVTIQDRQQSTIKVIMGWVMVAIVWTVLVHWAFLVAVKGFF